MMKFVMFQVNETTNKKPPLSRSISVPLQNNGETKRKTSLFAKFSRSLSSDQTARNKNSKTRENSTTETEIEHNCAAKSTMKSKETLWTIQGAWACKPMPGQEKEKLKNPISNDTNRKCGSFFARLYKKLWEVFCRKRSFQFKMTESLSLDGPYVNDIIGCSCGQCQQEYYVNKYVGYGIDVYGTNPCMVIPVHCHDFAVVYYC